MRGVDERCVSLRSYTERSSGGITSENAGMSSENYVRIIMVENLRFLEEGSSAQGKPGAKARSERRSRCTYGKDSVATEVVKYRDTGT